MTGFPSPVGAALLAQDGGTFIWLALPLVLVAFLLIVWLPERRQRAEQQRMRENLKKNDRVVTIGGIYGVVINAPKESEEVVLRIDDTTNTKVRVLRAAVARVVSEEKEKKGDSSSS